MLSTPVRMHERRDRPSRGFSLKTKIFGLLATILTVILIIFTIWTYNNERTSMQSEMLEQSRVLATEMNATWEFVSINQNTINYDSNDNFDYKGLHCAIAGKSVAALFSRHSDSAIRFTKLDPRNADNAPDEFETAALDTFQANSDIIEYYGFADEDGSRVFRYVSAMKVTENCLDCHGQPAGQIDLTGYPKEGLSLGDVGGAMSITTPTDLYYTNMLTSVFYNVCFFLLIMVSLMVAVYIAMNRMVTRPLDNLGTSLKRVVDSPSASVHIEGPDRVFGSTEVDVLFERFNSMSQTLSTLYGHLEGEVEDRTQQLAQANEQLERQRVHVEHVNEQLKKDNQYKSDFLAIVSHELRTPLTSIIAFTDLMGEHVPPDDDVMRKQLEEVASNGRTLLEMVNNILETARIQAGSERLNLELVDLSDVIGMVESTNESVAQKNGIALSTVIAPDTPLIVSDWEKVRRILTNLVSNAVKFTDTGGAVQVHVTFDEPTSYVVIAVIDTGIGIPADKQELVFERFTQENMSTARRYGGSGLGLALVKDLTSMLGGMVHLESSPGHGSTFTVLLPSDWTLDGPHAPGHADPHLDGPDAAACPDPDAAACPDPDGPHAPGLSGPEFDERRGEGDNEKGGDADSAENADETSART